MNSHLLPAARDLSVDAFRAAHSRHVRQKIPDELTYYAANAHPCVCHCYSPIRAACAQCLRCGGEVRRLFR
jgi:hypothetical protein